MKTIKTSLAKFMVAITCTLLIAAPHIAKANSDFDPASFRGPSDARHGGGVAVNTGGSECVTVGQGTEGATAPVDGGIVLLAIVGAAYGLRKVYLLNK